MSCIFCKIASGEIPAARVFEDEEFIAFKDINPAAKVHLLVIPRRHVATLNELTDSGLAGRWLLTAKEVARKAGLADNGYRVIINCNADGGQEVFHLHLHILGGEKIGHLNCLGSH